ncbi:prephenate dehydrogenase/arogenate dehydrogenase family protein, partial [Mycobacterium tuberculosis]|nr:prephenate dehydrogenase/arogenate dehydrogenase family protein [Mycobacterium tuberculosis]
VGIVGAGAFGRFAARHLGADFDIRLTDPDAMAVARAAEAGLAVVSFAEAAAADVVVLAVPWRRLAAVAGDLRPHLAPQAIIVDV